MSTSYSIYRFAKPTKYELAGIDYFSEYDSFYLHDSDGEQATGYIRLFRNTDKEIANIINSKFVHPLVLPEKVTDYEKSVDYRYYRTGRLLSGRVFVGEGI